MKNKALYAYNKRLLIMEFTQDVQDLHKKYTKVMQTAFLKRIEELLSTLKPRGKMKFTKAVLLGLQNKEIVYRETENDVILKRPKSKEQRISRVKNGKQDERKDGRGSSQPS